MSAVASCKLKRAIACFSIFTLKMFNQFCTQWTLLSKHKQKKCWYPSIFFCIEFTVEWFIAPDRNHIKNTIGSTELTYANEETLFNVNFSTDCIFMFKSQEFRTSFYTLYHSVTNISFNFPCFCQLTNNTAVTKDKINDVFFWKKMSFSTCKWHDQYLY